MKEYKWLSAFLDISNIVFKELYGKAGQMTSELGRGAGGDITMQIDKFSEEIFARRLETYHMPAVIISEESGKIPINNGGQTDPVILLDPIDGSLNLKRKLPFYSISMAKTGATINSTTVSCVMNLSNGDRFYAIKGRGAFKDNYFSLRHGDKAVRLKTDDNDNNKEILLTEALYLKSTQQYIALYVKLFKRIRAFGSIALDLCYLADSAADGFLHSFDSRSFDYAAGKLILEEAGGVFSDCDGCHFDAPSNLKKSGSFIASRNEKILKEMVRINRGVLCTKE